MSEDIVNRMKAEGQLIRNSGKHSIRSVKIQLDRFESIFETISDHIQMQTQFLADTASVSAEQLRINQETSERERARRQREDLAEQQESRETTTETKLDTATGKKERKGLFSLITGLGLGGIIKLLVGGLAIAGTGILAYNFLKGFIDEKTGGKFSDFEQGLTSTLSGIDWEGIKNDFFTVGTTVKDLSIKLTELLGIIQGFIDNPWSLFGIGAGLAAGKFLGGAALRTLFGGAAAAGGGAAAAGGGLLSRLLGFGARKVIPGAAFVTPDKLGDGTVSGQAVANLAEKNIVPPEESIANVSQDLYDSLLERYQERLDAEIKRIDEEMSAAAYTAAEIETNRTPEEEARLSELRAQNIERDRLAREQLESGYNPGNTKEDTAQDVQKYRTGTEGFQDFGAGTFAILHGREAVVPEETPAGRFIKQFFNDDFSPKIEGSSNVSDKVSQASGGVIMPVVVNNSPMVSPVINNVQGGPNVSTTNLFGGGGGDRSRNAYGITNAIN